MIIDYDHNYGPFQAVRLFVDKDEKDIFKQCFMKRMEGIQNYLTRKSGLESYPVDAIAEEVHIQSINL